MGKFPKDASRARVVTALEALGFQVVREREHIAMVRENADGSKTDLPPLNSTTSRERIWGWSKPREATNATRKEGTG